MANKWLGSLWGRWQFVDSIWSTWDRIPPRWQGAIKWWAGPLIGLAIGVATGALMWTLALIRDYWQLSVLSAFSGIGAGAVVRSGMSRLADALDARTAVLKKGG